MPAETVAKLLPQLGLRDTAAIRAGNVSWCVRQRTGVSSTRIA
jgi:hypothetical protein